MKPQNFRTKLFGSLALCTIAVAASPIAAQADEDGPSCTVSYYLTAPYEDETGSYDHVVVFEDDCERPVECQLESKDMSRTISTSSARHGAASAWWLAARSPSSRSDRLATLSPRSSPSQRPTYQPGARAPRLCTVSDQRPGWGGCNCRYLFDSRCRHERCQQRTTCAQSTSH